MNYLAHLFLSGSDSGVRVGNFIGDHVKGNDFKRYSPSIRKGILLHREIDMFTDNHPVFRNSTRYFYQYYRRYAGVVTDIVYDHFLAAKWSDFSGQPLKIFVSESHEMLMANYFSLPRAVQQFLPFIIKSRRIEHYKSLDGIEKTLKAMALYSSLPNHARWAVEQLTANYQQIQVEFQSFFPEITETCKNLLAPGSIIDRRAM